MTTTGIRAARRYLGLMLILLASAIPTNESFSIGPLKRVLPLPKTTRCSGLLVADGRQSQSPLASALRIEVDAEANVDLDQNNRLAATYNIAKIASSVAWIVTAYVALSFHPDPRFKDCTLRHNLLTMGQAFAFPLPILWASFEGLQLSAKNGTLQSPTARRLGLAVSAASFWLAASMAIPPKFAFGYDLYKQSHRVAATVIHGSTGLFALSILLRSSKPGEIFRGLVDSLWKLGPKQSASDQNSFEENSSLLATGCIGLLWFTILPIVSPYPLATIPTILGKRLSRPASAFTLLGSVMAYCLKEGEDSVPSTDVETVQRQDLKRILNRGLAMGSGSHLLLIALKLVGVDGGGWILPGRGLWEVYPAMMAVPFTAGVSMLVHAIVCFATWRFGFN